MKCSAVTALSLHSEHRNRKQRDREGALPACGIDP